jgi:hypothetical protein
MTAFGRFEKPGKQISASPLENPHANATINFVRLHVLAMKHVYLMDDCLLHHGFPLRQSG